VTARYMKAFFRNHEASYPIVQAEPTAGTGADGILPSGSNRCFTIVQT